MSESRGRDPGELAEHLERDVDKLERHSEEIQDEIEHVRQDWHRKRADQSVPGALAPESEEDDAQEGDEGSDEERGESEHDRDESEDG